MEEKDAIIALRGLMNAEDSANSSDVKLEKYLRWKSDPARANVGIAANREWCEGNPEIALNIRLTDPMLLKLMGEAIAVQPPGFQDGNGRPIIFVRLRRNICSRDAREAKDLVRMIIYNIERVLEREEAQRNGVVVVHDMKLVGWDNIMPSAARLFMGAIFGGKVPVRLSAVYVLNAPFFFPALLKLMGMALSKKIRARIHRCGSIPDLAAALSMDESRVSEFVLRTEEVHDQASWVNEQLEREMSGGINTKDLIFG